MIDKSEREPLDPYILMHFADKEQLEATGFTCPLCHETGALVESDSFLKDSRLYHGVKYLCNSCDDSVVAIDDSCLTKTASEELKDKKLIRVEFAYADVLDIVDLQQAHFE